MIDIISLWIGRIMLGTILFLLFSVACYYIIGNFTERYIEVKAIAYALLSNLKNIKNKGLSSKANIRVGRKWYVTLKGKTYLWECTEEKVAKK